MATDNKRLNHGDNEEVKASESELDEGRDDECTSEEEAEIQRRLEDLGYL